MPLWRRESTLRLNEQPNKLETDSSHRHSLATRLLPKNKSFNWASSCSSSSTSATSLSSQPLPRQQRKSSSSCMAAASPDGETSHRASRVNLSGQDHKSTSFLPPALCERHSIWWESSRLSATSKIDRFVIQLESSESPRSLDVCREDQDAEQTVVVDQEEEEEAISQDMTIGAGMWAFEEEEVSSMSSTSPGHTDLPLLELLSSKHALDADPLFELDLVQLNPTCAQLNRSDSLAHTVSSGSCQSDVAHEPAGCALIHEEQDANPRESFLQGVNLAAASQLFSAIGGKGTVKSGILFKQELNWLRSSWKARYVALDFRQLKVYTEENGKLRSQLNLTQLKPDQIEVMPADSVFDGQHATMWRFAVRLRRSRIFFAAYSERDLNDWIHALQIALAVSHAAPGRFTDLVLRQSPEQLARDPRCSDFLQ